MLAPAREAGLLRCMFVFAVDEDGVVASVTVVVAKGRDGRGGRSRVGNHAYLGARTRRSWSGHMMMMGSFLPGCDSRSAGARPFKLPRPARDTVLASKNRVTV
jgi:hypothetical protein